MGLNLSGLIGRRFLIVFGLTFLTCGAISAEASDVKIDRTQRPEATLQKKTSSFERFLGHLESEFTLSAGMRTDSLDWSIAATSSGGSPNIVSELTWSDVDSYQISISNRSYYKKNIYFRGAANFGWIQEGQVCDSDYGQDFRQAEWSRSISQSNDDEVWDINLGGGYAFFFMQDRLSIAPMFGVSYHKQNLRITNGRQVISEDNPFSGNPNDNPPPVGPLPAQLNSTYFTRWIGPWAGFDLRYKLQERYAKLPPIQLGLSMEWHWVDYYGEGNWNLRQELEHPKSFEHSSRGNGISVTGECLVKMAAHWDLSVACSFQDWTTRRGSNRHFYKNGDTINSRFNKANWKSTSLMIGAVYRF